jgi:hypothetical protein
MLTVLWFSMLPWLASLGAASSYPHLDAGDKMYTVTEMLIDATVADVEVDEYTLVDASEQCLSMAECHGFTFAHPEDETKMAVKGGQRFVEGKVTVFFKGAFDTRHPPLTSNEGWSSFFKDENVAQAGKAMRKAAEDAAAKGEVWIRPGGHHFSPETIKTVEKVLRLYGEQHGLLTFADEDGEPPMTKFEEAVIPGSHPELAAGDYTLAEAYGLCAEDPACFGITYSNVEPFDFLTTKMHVWFFKMLTVGQTSGLMKNEDEFVMKGENFTTYAKPRQDRKSAPPYIYEEGEKVIISNPTGLVSYPMELFGGSETLNWPTDIKEDSLDGGKWVETWYKNGFTGEVVKKWTDCEKHFPVLLSDSATLCYLVVSSSECFWFS